MLIIVASAYLHVCGCQSHGHIHYGESESTSEFWSMAGAKSELEKIKSEMSEEEYLAVKGQIEMSPLNLASPLDGHEEEFGHHLQNQRLREYQKAAPYN